MNTAVCIAHCGLSVFRLVWWSLFEMVEKMEGTFDGVLLVLCFIFWNTPIAMLKAAEVCMALSF